MQWYSVLVWWATIDGYPTPYGAMHFWNGGEGFSATYAIATFGLEPELTPQLVMWASDKQVCLLDDDIEIGFVGCRRTSSHHQAQPPHNIHTTYIMHALIAVAVQRTGIGHVNMPVEPHL